MYFPFEFQSSSIGLMDRYIRLARFPHKNETKLRKTSSNEVVKQKTAYTDIIPYNYILWYNIGLF